MEDIYKEDIGYKMHCCDLLLAEIKNEMDTYKDLSLITTLLALDTIEIISHYRNRNGRFLLGNYSKGK